MANYTVPADDWTDIETLMDTDYDATDNLALYVNQIALGLLQVAVSSTKPTETGMQLPSFATYAIGAGAGTTTWVKASASPIEVYIYEAS